MRRIILIDMDETLGTFTQISTFLTALTDLCNGLDYNKEFFNAMNLFTCFQRPGIIPILKHMVSLRNTDTINKIVLYTNNQGSNEWVRLIASFFDSQVGCRVFDDIIFAYTVHGRINDIRRTTDEKILDDVHRCIDMYCPTKFLFIDDVLHRGMVRNEVTYLRIEPYTYSMSSAHMAAMYHNRYIKHDIPQEEFVTSIVYLMSMYKHKHTNINRSRDKYMRLSDKIMKQLIHFSRS
jgi:hypothetical protein